MSTQDQVSSETNDSADKQKQVQGTAQEIFIEKSDNAEAKGKELKKILDFYFESDRSLREKYASAQPVETLLSLPVVMAMNPNLETLKGAIRGCKKLKLEDNDTKVRGDFEAGRTTLILRDLPKGTQYERVKKLLEEVEDCRVKEIRPELNNNWFVRFATQDECLKAAQYLTFSGKIDGVKVKCRVKSVLKQSSYSQQNNQSYRQPMANPYAYQQQQGKGTQGKGKGKGKGKGWYGNQYPQMSPNMAPWMGMPPSPIMGSMHNQRRNSNSRRNSGRGGRNKRQERRNSGYGNKNRGRQNNNPAPPTNTDDCNYKAPYKSIERMAFDELARQQMAKNPKGPAAPEALTEKAPQLITSKPKFKFDVQLLKQGSTISPMPDAQTATSEPPALDLGAASSSKGKAVKVTKSPPAPKGFSNDDQKEESPAKVDTTPTAI